ncbi:MAG: hypothetical protein LBM95_01925 [Lactobacillales bacterium]|nr:hypothetical protein [Lactobacillales bacterium]
MTNFKALLIASLTLGTLSVVNIEARAQEQNGPEQAPILRSDAEVTTRFTGMNDSDSLLILPDGEFLHGEVEISTIDEPEKILEKYNSNTDPKAKTVAEIKRSWKTQPVELLDNVIKENDLLRGAAPAPLSALKTLVGGETYLSNGFSGRGWRYAESYYRPATGTGKFLRWETIKDSGIVGDREDANKTYRTGIGYGYKIYPGHPQSVTGINNTLTYYTYNPIKGSYYSVANY